MNATTTASETDRNSKYPRAILKTWPHIPEEILELFPINFARTCRAIPVFVNQGQVTVAVDDEPETDKILAIEGRLPNQKIIFLIAQKADMDEALYVRYSLKLLDSRS